MLLPLCPHCGSTSIHPRGSVSRPNRYQCSECRKHFVDRGSPQALVFDIETLPIIGTFWDIGKQYLGTHQILEDSIVLSWSAKALFDQHIIGDILTPAEARRRINSVFEPDPKPTHDADYRIVKRIWRLIDEADVVIYQNGDKFDLRVLNSRFIYYGFPPYRPVHTIDTLKAAQSVMRLPSHKLDYMMKFLSLPRKQPTNHGLWMGCQIGDPKALKQMYQYGLNDTLILEDYYARIRAWIPNHPNFSAYTHNYLDLEIGEVACPVCRQVIAPEAINGTYRTPLGNTYDSFRCPHCGAVGRRSKKRPGGPAVRRAG